MTDLSALMGFSLPTAEQVEGELLSRSLHEFSLESWKILEPGTEFKDNWHLEVIDEHLEAVTRGKIRHLIINIPPRTMKSTKVNVQWPAWEWTLTEGGKFGDHRSEQYLSASYGDDLATRDAFKTRLLVESDWYQARFPHVQIRQDQSAKTRFVNSRNGHRIITSIRGSPIGEGGTRLLVDDPHDPKKTMVSDVQRKEALDWWDNSMVTRMNNPKRDAAVIVMQRTHQMDLTGHLISTEPGKWEHLLIPMEYDGVRRKTSLGEYDPRTKKGELLWPERYGPAEVASLKLALRSYGTAAQLQQQPAPFGGGVIKISWFKRYKVMLSKFTRIVQSWDTAQKGENTNAYSVCTTWGEVDWSSYYLLDVYREHMEYPALKRAASNLAARDLQKYKRLDIVLIEDKSSGSSLIQDLRQVKGFPARIFPIEPEGDKVTRADTSMALAEAGAVYLPEEADWMIEFENELGKFPNTEHKDQVDSTSQFLNWVVRRQRKSGMLNYLKQLAEKQTEESKDEQPA